jgi:arsenite-transporting ATPase
MRIIVFTGNGGAGVSTLAAATAVAVANSARRTLAFGLSAGIGAALAQALSTEPKAVSANLQALEGRQRYDEPDEFRDWLEDLLDFRGMEIALAEDLAALPGMNHVGRLLELEQLTGTGDFDVIVVDGAALVQFLDLPPALDAAARWLERLFAPRQSNVFEPFMRVFAGDYAEKGEDVLERGRELLGRLAALRELLTDPEVATVRIVLNADARALAATEEAVAALSLFSHSVDAIVLNRVLPPEVDAPFFADMRSEQEQALRDTAAAVSPMPVLEAALVVRPPLGVEQLAALADGLYGEQNPADVLHILDGHSFVKENGRYVISLALPFAKREDVNLEQIDEGVEIHLNGRRCVLSLPEEVRHREAASWAFEPPMLKITFR